jgi:AmmeMemoRadiSam system protein A
MSCIEAAMFDPHELANLAALAALVIRQTLAEPALTATPYRDERFAAPGASFVTLKQQGRLRGCIGSLEARRALHDDVAANALAAALRDPRFPPLARHELPHTEVEISVLSAPAIMSFESEQEFFEQLRPGVDGLILEHLGRRATYLPSVWEQLPEAGLFVRELRRKAGIENSVALTALRVQRYTTEHSSPRPILSV